MVVILASVASILKSIFVCDAIFISESLMEALLTSNNLTISTCPLSQATKSGD